MPPRFAYWTIIAGGLPTAFRAAEREELEPTFARLKEKQPDAEMKWFARGKLWSSPEEQRADTAQRAERRDNAWRPGGSHRDPRQPFKDAKRERNQRWRKEKFERRSAGPSKPHGDALTRPPRPRDERPRYDERSRRDEPRNEERPRKPWNPEQPRGEQKVDWRGRPVTRREERPRNEEWTPKPREERAGRGWTSKPREAREGGWKSKPHGDTRERRESREPRERRESREPRESRERYESREWRESREQRESRDRREPRETRESREKHGTRPARREAFTRDTRQDVTRETRDGGWREKPQKKTGFARKKDWTPKSGWTSTPAKREWSAKPPREKPHGDKLGEAASRPFEAKRFGRGRPGGQKPAHRPGPKPGPKKRNR